MRLISIISKNFRTLEDTKVIFKSNYCTLSGHNNAGKSNVVKLICSLLYNGDRRPWSDSNYSVDYSEDKTQWIKTDADIKVEYTLNLTRLDDQALVEYIERISTIKITANELVVLITMTYSKSEEIQTCITVAEHELDKKICKDILKRLKSSNSIFLHNSTQESNDYYIFGGGKSAMLYDLPLSPEDRKLVIEAEDKLQSQLKKVAKVQTGQLNAILGKLSDKFDVEFTTMDTTNRFTPFRVSLTDSSVEVPLPEWGSGTQNRTKILMSILQATRIKTRNQVEDRVTPIVIIEEPESFLHPSAQAEFGKVLQSLSEEMSIQIIVSTHSPYMLNQTSPESNILMKRKLLRKKAVRSEIMETTGDHWMVPFSEHLGLIPPEFDSWRSIIANSGSSLLLVEGDTDREYIEFFRTTLGHKFPLPSSVEVVSYNGKDALKNTAMVKFILSKMEKYFVTFDLDASKEVAEFLVKIGLVEGKAFCAIGVDKPGKASIEGIIPDRVTKTVYGRETDHVSALMSGKSNERSSAKSYLKRMLLEEFKKHDDYTDAELKDIIAVGKTIARPFG